VGSVQMRSPDPLKGDTGVLSLNGLKIIALGVVEMIT
jgi:hypothetical protein